ncbi:MAG: hypothetical protein H0U27_06215, partial [Nitrosopumilus sp.]|nr:hypothetical protein [Nitrosopumilus sp.]
YCSNICETLKDSIIDDTNLSYLPAQIQMLKLIGDTLEFYIATTLEDTCYICIPITNEPIINILGFYPNSDTVTYFAMDGMKYNRKPQNIDHSANQKKDFENHIKNNSKSLNYWMINEAKKRNILN